jgi:hypothetical protein
VLSRGKNPATSSTTSAASGGGSSQILLGAVLVAAVQFVCVALRVGLLAAPVLSLLAFVYWRLVRPDERDDRGHRGVVSVAALGVFAGTAIAWLSGFGGSPWVWASVPLAAIVASSGFSLAFSGRAQACQLCRLPAPEGAGFTCPRCHDRVCARPSCWNARYFRCTRCHEREIIALPVQESWWLTRLGKRIPHGECSHCYKEAHEADLRECGQCRWPLCKRCWDHMNGVCSHCGWIVPDLPPALAAFMASAGASRPARATAGRAGAAAAGRARAEAPAAPAPEERPSRPYRSRR